MITSFFEKNKKEIDRVEDDFNCNIVLYPNDLLLFYEKNLNGLIFTYSKLKRP